jgi:hypothetical protein
VTYTDYVILDEARVVIAAALASELNKDAVEPLGSADQRGLMRQVQEFCPESATTSFEIFRQAHLTGADNYVCTYHQLHSSVKTKLRDGEEDALYEIMGQPLPPRIAGSKKKAKTRDEDGNPIPGYFHCGCDEKEVAVGFYIWKTWSLTRLVENDAETDSAGKYTGKLVNGREVTESLDTDHLTPRLRSFVVAFLAKAGYTVDTIYTGTRTVDEAELDLVKKRIRADIAWVNEKGNKTGDIRRGEEYWLAGGPPSSPINPEMPLL